MRLLVAALRVLVLIAGLLLWACLLLLEQQGGVPAEVAIADAAGGIVIVPVPSPVRPTPTPMADLYALPELLESCGALHGDGSSCVWRHGKWHNSNAPPCKECGR